MLFDESGQGNGGVGGRVVVSLTPQIPWRPPPFCPHRNFPSQARVPFSGVALPLRSLLGIVVLLLLAWSLSEHRKRIPIRVILWGLTLQFSIGAFILKTRIGEQIFLGFQRAVQRLIGFSEAGNQLVFGPLAQGDVLGKSFGPQNATVLIIVITGTIVLVAALSSLLYHYGVLQWVVRGMAWGMRGLMGTSGSETLAAAANIFMGQTEAPLVIRPYLPRMTRSELLCLMVGGFSTIAGGVLAVYVTVLQIPAGHLLTASVMSAPAAVMMAKLLLPETEASETAAGAPAIADRETVNGLDAMVTGAADGMKLSLNVAAMLMAFTAIVALINYLLSSALGWMGLQTPQPLQLALGWINAPFAWIMGIPTQDCRLVGQALGERIVLNEFIGYNTLSSQHAAGILQQRSYVLATYALCGFANFASIAIQIGGIGALCPSRRADLARLGFKAMLGGLLACYLTACVVGVIS